MCRKKKQENNTSDNKNVEKSLVFMNIPIKTIDDDIIGFSTHIQKIKSAIDNDAQMVAITSPFGAGKTSISELLQAEYKDSEDTKVIKVSMWSHLCNRNADTTGATEDLHRSLVYQIISQISHQRGKYVSKLLNPNYGVLRLYTNSPLNFVLILISALMFFFGYLLPEKFGINVPLLATEKNIVESIMLLASITLAIVTVMRSEIVFSSRKSENDRKIDSNDIMQIYRCASYYLNAYNTYVCAMGSGRVEIWFEVMGTGIMDELGTLSIKLYESTDNTNWTRVKTFSHENYDSMLIEDDFYHSSCVSYQGVAGRYYKAYVCIWAGKNGSGDTRYMWTSVERAT